MQTFVPITCPQCGEGFETAFDASEGNAEFVVDCEICCRPINVTVHTRHGEIDDVRITAG